jgi:hypothetical protein
MLIRMRNVSMAHLLHSTNILVNKLARKKISLSFSLEAEVVLADKHLTKPYKTRTKEAKPILAVLIICSKKLGPRV